MHMVCPTCDLDKLPSATNTNLLDGFLDEEPLVGGQQNRGMLQPPGNHPLSGIIVFDNRQAVGIAATVYRSARIAVKPRTVRPERDVICQR